ncbi:MAG: DNA repair protein RecN [Acidimicrobiia bacterium]
MLSELHVEHLGVIDSISVLIGPGMTALTGETGAGKTLVVEAIELLVGGRADPLLVRPGAEEARVEGRFLLGDEEVVLSRVIPRTGRSRAYVNGRLATVASLVEYGERLVDLHGQHAHQSLLASAAQRGALDRFAGVDHGPLRAARDEVARIDAALAAMGGDARARARELDLLRYQLDELDRANVTNGDEDRSLEDLEDRLAGASEHRERAAAAIDALIEDGAALDGVRAAMTQLHGRAPFAAQLIRLRSLVAELDDVAGEIRHVADGIDEDPAKLAEVRARRQLLVELRRKYGDTLSEVMEEHRRIAERAEELASHDRRAAELDAARVAAIARVAAEAAVVAEVRRGAAPRLARAVEEHLRTLALPRARVEIVVGGDDPGDEVAFLLATNKGEPTLPLAKVASGGELARAMLALRLVLTAGPETLVFDEVDAGIGGEAAVTVGRALASLGSGHQVLVVTHLPQVAACADQHLAVSKRESEERTVSEIRSVKGNERVDELARMLAGSVTTAARRHAKELLAGPVA